jgi:hypothetical protein
MSGVALVGGTDCNCGANLADTGWMQPDGKRLKRTRLSRLSRTRGRLAVMRKRLITQKPQDSASPNEDWLDLESAAVVEVTSEEKGYPVESALVSDETQGWRAADSGSQTIRLVFDVPQRIRCIWLVFEETVAERTQEFVLRWFSDGGHSFREIVRQQWNFSPPDTTRETEDYRVELSEVTILELVIVPDRSRGVAARASLKSLRLA